MHHILTKLLVGLLVFFGILWWKLRQDEAQLAALPEEAAALASPASVPMR